MTFPALTVATNAFSPGTLSTPIPSEAQVNQSFGVQAHGWCEVDANGIANDVPLGQSGPFLLEIGTEQILCVADQAGIISVFDDAGVNGRGYNSTSLALHTPGSSVKLISTSVQSVATGGGGGGGGTTLSLYYNGVGPFDVPVSSLPAGYSGGIATLLAQLTTGPGLITGLLDTNGNPIPDGWTFPALIFVEGTNIYDIVMLNDYAFNAGGGWAWYGTSGGQPSFALGAQGIPNLSTGYGSPVNAVVANYNQVYLDMTPGGSGLWIGTGTTMADWFSLGGIEQAAGLSYYPGDPGVFSVTLGALGAGQSAALETLGGEIVVRDGYIELGGYVSGQSNANVNLFILSGTPNGVITPIATGDVCIDITNFTVWFATNSGDTAWVLSGDAPTSPSVSGSAVEIPSGSKNVVVSNDADAAVAFTLDTAGAYAGMSKKIMFYDYSSAAQSLTWVNTENSTVSVPSTSNGSTTEPLTIGFIFNAVTNLWRCVAVA